MLVLLAFGASTTPEALAASSREGREPQGAHLQQLSFIRHDVHTESSGGFHFFHVRFNDADLDANGWPDVVSPFFADYCPSYWQQSAFVFNTQILNVANQAYGLCLADLDGDGDQDMALAAAWTGSIYWLRNDAGTLTGPYTIGSSSFPNHIHPGDLDGDGDIDLVWTCELDGFFVAWNDGSGNFTTQNISAQAGPENVWLADIDGDGDLDIAACGHSYGGGPNEVIWFENQGGSFVKHVIDNAKIDPHGLWAGDLDSDGDADIVVAFNFFNMGGPNEVHWYENDGFGNFTDHLVGPINYGSAVQGVDIDNDGDVDIVASGGGADENIFYNYGELAVFVNDGSQNFTKEVIVDTGSYGFWAGDYNGDQCPDIAAIIYRRDNSAPTTFVVWENTTPGCAYEVKENKGAPLLRVIPARGGIWVEARKPGVVRVFSAAGRLAAQKRVDGKAFFRLPPGIYAAELNGQVAVGVSLRE